LYRVRNSIDALPGFGGPAESNSSRLGPIIQEEQKMGSINTIRSILNFKNLTKTEGTCNLFYIKKSTLSFCKMVEI